MRLRLESRHFDSYLFIVNLVIRKLNDIHIHIAAAWCHGGQKGA